MTLTNTPQGLVKDSTEKVWRLGGSLHHKTARQFAISKWWQTLLRSAVYAGIGMLFSAMIVTMMATFPWDDSTVEQKRLTLFVMLPWFLICHGPGAVLFFTFAVRTWADPYTLIFDRKGGLVLQSVAHDQFIAIKDIRTVVLVQQKNDEDSNNALGIRTKFWGGKLKLPLFVEREEFLNALKAANPAIVVETV